MDLELVSGEFMHDNIIPKDRRWLLKYFKNESQRRFLSYYIVFSDLRNRSPGHFHQNFVDHTGVYCTKRAMQKWSKKLHDLLSIVEKATAELDFVTLELVKSGRFRFSHANKAKGNLNNR